MGKHFRPNSGAAGTKSRIEIDFFAVVVSGNVITAFSVHMGSHGDPI
jgi:hypothetical protein